MIDFSLLGVNDSYFNSVDISNKKKIVIFFTCNHCPYVHAYEKRIIKLQKSYRDIVQFIGINSNDDTKYPEDSFEKMKERSRDNNFNFIYVRDLYQEVAKIYNASHTPHFFLFKQQSQALHRPDPPQYLPSPCYHYFQTRRLPHRCHLRPTSL